MSSPASSLPPADPDLELVQRAQNGEFAAFGELVERYQRRVYGLARRIVGESHDAESADEPRFPRRGAHSVMGRRTARNSASAFQVGAAVVFAINRPKPSTISDSCTAPERSKSGRYSSDGW